MTTQYTQEHYEDVARIIAEAMNVRPDRPNRNSTLREMAQQFADLFAADNPGHCRFCGTTTEPNKDSRSMCTAKPFENVMAVHEYVGGFNRARFLAACGLES